MVDLGQKKVNFGLPFFMFIFSAEFKQKLLNFKYLKLTNCFKRTSRLYSHFIIDSLCHLVC